MTLYKLLALSVFVNYFQLSKPLACRHGFVQLATFLTDFSMLIQNLQKIISNEIGNVIRLRHLRHLLGLMHWLLFRLHHHHSRIGKACLLSLVHLFLLSHLRLLISKFGIPIRWKSKVIVEGVLLVCWWYTTDIRIEYKLVLTFIMLQFGSPSHQVVPFGPCLTRYTHLGFPLLILITLLIPFLIYFNYMS